MCLDEGLSGGPIFWSRAVTAVRGKFFAIGGVHVPGGQAPLVGAPAGPTVGIVQCDEALFLQPPARKRPRSSTGAQCHCYRHCGGHEVPVRL